MTTGRDPQARAPSGRGRRNAPYRDPNIFEIVVGLTVFIVMTAALFYLIAAIGA